MKTLIVTLEYPPQIGGIANYVYNFSKHYSNCSVYAPKMAGDNNFDAGENIKVFRRSPLFAFFWPKWLKMFFQIKKIIKQEKIEMLHIHNVLPSGHAAYLLRNKVSYIIFLHGTDIEMATKNIFKAASFKRICKHAAKIVVNSEFLKNKLRAKIENIEEKKIIILNPCPGDIFLERVSADEIKKLKSQLALDGKKIALTVTRIEEGKGLPHFIRVLPQIIEKVPNLVWVIIGDGHKRKYVLDLISKNNLQSSVRFLGQVPYNQLPKYYQMADLFVLLTHPDELAEEGWGMVFVEAAASGLPVVAGKAGGVEEAVINLQTGLLVDAHIDQSVISAVSDLLLETAYAKKMGDAGHSRVLSELVWDKQINKLL